MMTIEEEPSWRRGLRLTPVNPYGEWIRFGRAGFKFHILEASPDPTNPPLLPNNFPWKIHSFPLPYFFFVGHAWSYSCSEGSRVFITIIGVPDSCLVFLRMYSSCVFPALLCVYTYKAMANSFVFWISDECIYLWLDWLMKIGLESMSVSVYIRSTNILHNTCLVFPSLHTCIIYRGRRSRSMFK